MTCMHLASTGRFAGKHVVVLGGNSGIGRAAALGFADEGAYVVATGRNAVTLADVAEALGKRGETHIADITDMAASRALMADLALRLGRIDVLVVNAGTGAFRPVEAVDEAFYDEIMSINLKGPYFAVQTALPLMGAGSSIVLTSSIGHCKGIAGNSVYAASKAGLRSLARNFGVEMVARGIRVNCFSPGPIDTPLVSRGDMTAEQIAGFRTMIEESVPMRRFGTPQEAADAILFLASPQASFISGIDLIVDGGLVSF